MPTITILEHLFTIDEIDGQIIVSFEGNQKETIEMEYSRDEFLKYFSIKHATNLESYLQRRFPHFELKNEKHFEIQALRAAGP